LFDDARAHLRAGLDETSRRDETGTSCSGDVNEFIVGGGLQLRMKSGSVRTVPTPLKVSDVEHRCYFALSSLGGEHEDGMWWAPEHELVALSKSDPLAGAKQAIRRSWSAVNKRALPSPIYAPKFPKTVGAPETWAALVQHAVELHNEGSLKGFISTGAGWPEGSPTHPVWASGHPLQVDAYKICIHMQACRGW
jgi:hypothetical protein